MKMLDHFNHQLNAENITSGLSDTKWGLVDEYGIATTELKMKAAAHAVNCHDELVGTLEEALKAMLINGFDPDCVPVVKLKYTLKKARGEL